MAGAGIPEEDLARVGTAYEEVGVEGGEGDGEDVRLREIRQGIAREDAMEGCTCAWKTNSGRSRRCRFQIQAMPSGSLTAMGFLLYEAANSSGNCHRRPISLRISA